MHRIQKLVAIPLMGMALVCTQAVFAQGRQAFHDHYVRHTEWRKGYHMPPADWGRGVRVANWQVYHLRRPPAGYEWRRIDGNFVLGAVSTGVVFSVVVGH